MATSPQQSDHHQPPLLTHDQQKQETLEEELTSLQKAISQTFEGTSNLAKHLPSCTLLAFHLLSPILTKTCTNLNDTLIIILITLCTLSCFILAFSDTFRDPITGRVRYGFATLHGLIAIDGLPQPSSEFAKKYKMRGKDFVHGVMAMLVFGVVALMNKNVEGCFYPNPSEGLEIGFRVVPLVVGVLGSYVSIAFPNTRNGIGFPLKSN